MIWIIVIILILVVIFLFSSQKHNKSVEEYHLKKGGLRKSFTTITNHLENFYNISFNNDTGRCFSYSKEIIDTNGNKGKLIIGIKLDMRDEPNIFSKFESKFKGEFLGVDVTGIEINSVKAIDNSINISLDKIKTEGVINYQDYENKIVTHSVSKEFIENWDEISKMFSDFEFSEELDSFINDFFILDLINPQKFTENLDVLDNCWKYKEGNYGTASIKNIIYIPPAFRKLFLAAYPDVYEWVQEYAKIGKIEIFNKLQNLSDDEQKNYFVSQQRLKEFYRSLINQFKNDGHKLETQE